MPYQIKNEDGKFCVYNTDTKKKKGEFDTRAQAMGKMKALYAAEKDGKGEKETKAESMADDEEED